MRKILKSLAKYPLPLLSASQALHLEGVGNKMAALIGSVVRQKYKDFLVDEDQENKKRPPQEEETEPEREEISELRPEPKRLDIVNEEDNSNISIRSATRTYNPPKLSTSWATLIALAMFEAQKSRKYADKREIKDMITQVNRDYSTNIEINNWSFIKTLIKHNLVTAYDFSSVEKYSLTKDGELLASKLMADRTREAKDVQEPKKERIVLQENLDRYRFGTSNVETSNPEGGNSTTIPFADLRETISETFVISKSSVKKFEVKLLVDNRELSNNRDRSYIQEKVIESGFPCESMALPLGDFLWVVQMTYVNGQGKDVEDTFVLDFVVERKTADDLAASIMDGRYKEQKYRLSICGLSHVYYLIEGKASKNAVLNQTIIDKAVVSTRVSNHFFIHHTSGVEETVKWLLYMSNNIRRKVQNDIAPTVSFENFVALSGSPSKTGISFKFNMTNFRKMAKSANTRISSLFGNMLRVIKGCGREHTALILQHFKTPLMFYERLKLLDEPGRLEFLSGGLKINTKRSKLARSKSVDIGDNVKLSLPRPFSQMISTLFTAREYPMDMDMSASQLV
eukprot:TRINITY_DN4020_c0_g1_i4.p1 TRINITY_DN4020_c0_g1~~TRINITY_DN4020_c0_g1_i4.p1  ORF type:complete len:569 (+),score=135.95 TRINITY_DN4020_c0_g1_i4:153-1859(+)